MLPDSVVAACLVFFLSTFFAVNLYNILIQHRGRRGGRVYAEVQRPSGPTMYAAAFGTLMLFLEMLAFPAMVFTGFGVYLHVPPLQLAFPFDSYVQVAGAAVLGAGWFIFLWSVIVRGRYSVAWEMVEDHRLVTWGPYRYVRHPSYLGYFLMFCGFFLLWLNLIALLPLIAIPGYVKAATREEELLIRRFGEDYRRYQERTGRFFPRRRRK